MFNCPHCGGSARSVVVEAECDVLDAEFDKPLEHGRADAGTAERADVLDPVRSQGVNIDHTLHEDNLAATIEGSREHGREPIGRQAGSCSPTQVEVAAPLLLALLIVRTHSVRALPCSSRQQPTILPGQRESANTPEAPSLRLGVSVPFKCVGQRATIREQTESRNARSRHAGNHAPQGRHARSRRARP